MSSNDIGPKGMVRLLSSVSMSETIIHLDISSHEGIHRNRIGFSGAKMLRHLLSKNKVLTLLNLKGVSLNIYELEIISKGFEGGNSNLNYLNLCRNEINHGSNSEAVFNSLICRSKLTELNLCENYIGQIVR